MRRAARIPHWVLLVWLAGICNPGRAAEYVFRVSEALSDDQSTWELQATRFCTWGVRSFVLARGEVIEDAVLEISDLAFRPEANTRNLLRIHLLDTAENPYNWLLDEGLFPRGRLRCYEDAPPWHDELAELPWTAKVEIGQLEAPEPGAEPATIRWSLKELGLLETFQQFLANGNNFGLGFDPEGDFGAPRTRFVVITRDPIPIPAPAPPSPVPRIRPDPVRMAESGSTWVLVLVFLGGALAWIRWRRK